MSLLDPKLHQKLRELENLNEIEARLARQERSTRMALLVMMVLTASAFALLLGHVLSPAWLPLGH